MIIDTSQLVLLAIPGVTLWVVSRLLTMVELGQRNKTANGLVLRWIAILLMLLGLVGLISQWVSPFGVTLLPFLLFGLLSYLFLSRRATREWFVGCIESAMVMGVDVTPLAVSLATHSRGSKRRQRKFANELLAGTKPSQAFRNSKLQVAVPMQVQGYTMDEPMLLAPHLDVMMEEERAYRNAVRRMVESSLYLTAVLLVGSLLLTFVSWQAGSVTMLRYFDDVSWAESPVEPFRTNYRSFNGVRFYVSMGLSILSFVLMLILAIIYLELLPKHLWPWSLVHRRYNHAQAIWLWSVLSQEGCQGKEAFAKLEAAHPYPGMRRAASLAVQSIDQGRTIDESLRCAGWGSEKLWQRLARIPVPSIAVEHAFDWARQEVDQARDGWVWIERGVVPFLMLLIGLWLGYSVILFFQALHSILVVPY